VQTESVTALDSGLAKLLWIVIGAAAGLVTKLILDHLTRPTLYPDVELLPVFATNVDTAKLFNVTSSVTVGDLIENAVFYFLRIRYSGWKQAVDCDLPQIYMVTEPHKLLPLGTTFWNGHPQTSRTLQKNAANADFCLCMLDQDSESGQIRLWNSNSNRWCVCPETTRVEVVVAPSSSKARVRSRLLELVIQREARGQKLEVRSWAKIRGAWD